MYAKEYVDYLVHFHGTRDYFECHEILEDYWKKADTNNKQSILVAFILLAVSCYHHRRGNFPGAFRTLKKSHDIFSAKKEEIVRYGLEPDTLLSFIQKKLSELENRQTYASFTLPIIDAGLLDECRKICLEKGVQWGAASDLANPYLIDRHLFEYKKRKQNP